MKTEGKKKKNFWKALGEGLLEILGEILLTGIFLAVGVGVLALFGKTVNWDTVDTDVLTLLGFLALIAVAFVIGLTVTFFKKRKARKTWDPREEEKKGEVEL